MTTALFHNFTNEPFTGYWNGRSKTFKAGAQVYMEAYLAEHYAKHLANKVLIEQNEITSTSPKKPEQVPKFMELFNKACILQDDTDGQDEAEVQTDLLNRPRPAVEVETIVDKKQPQMIAPNVEDVDDEDDFEGLHDKSAMSDPVEQGGQL